MTDYDLQQKLIEQRRQQYGQQSQFQAPQGQMVSGHFVAPNALQYLAAGLRSIGGMRGEEMAGQELQDLQKQRTEGKQKALANFLRQAQGTPENMSAAFAELIKSPDRDMQQAALSWMVKIPEMQAARDDRIAEREAQAQQRMQELQFQHESRMQIMREQNASREQMAREQREHAASMAKLVASLRQSAAGSGAQPYYQPVQTAGGVMAFNARTGRMEPVVGADGQPIIGAQADPRLQGAIAGAKTGAQEGAKSKVESEKAVRKSDQMLQVAQDAEKLLKQGPTGSGIGAAIDKAGRLVGASSKSNELASQLETMSGWLVANVPRMEGPQSNFDLQNYQTMSGMIGDRTRPVSERLKALQTVKNLQTKYKALNQGDSGQVGGQAKVRKYNPATGRIE